MSLEILALIHSLLKKCDNPNIKDLSFDNDNDSGELIITWDNGIETTDFIVSSIDVKELEE